MGHLSKTHIVDVPLFVNFGSVTFASFNASFLVIIEPPIPLLELQMLIV